MECSIVWDSAPVRQSFGKSNVVFDGVVSVHVDKGGLARDFRVNVTATTGGRNPMPVLRYMTEAKRGHLVPANVLPDVHAYVIEQAKLHLADYRAAYVAEAKARDAEFMAERQPLKLSASRQHRREQGAAMAEIAKQEAAPADVAAVTLAGTIDMTPTWAGILPALLAALINGTQEGQRIAREELARLAKIADNCVTYQRQRDAESARAVTAEGLAASRLAEASAARIKLDAIERLAQRSADCVDSHFVTVRGLREAFPHIVRESN